VNDAANFPAPSRWMLVALRMRTMSPVLIAVLIVVSIPVVVQ
jgi:hypothetical protein